MSVLRYSLITLLIHHYSYEKYYQRHDEYVEKENKKSGVPFEQLSEISRKRREDLWWWPPWKFNDIVGFIEIGMDIGDYLTADIYLKRKYLPRDHVNRRIGFRSRTHEFLYFIETNKVPVREKKNESYLIALNKVLKEAKRIIKKRNRHFELFLPPFELCCIDFVKAHKQAEELDRPE